MRRVGQVANQQPIGNRLRVLYLSQPEIARSSARPINNRPQVNNLPYIGPLTLAPKAETIRY
jgi:hypothetical protein